MRDGNTKRRWRRFTLVLVSLTFGSVFGLAHPESEFAARATDSARIASGSRNPYDKFRGASYSNEGLYPERDEIRLGQELHKQLQKEQKIVQDPLLARYVQQLGEKLARLSKRPDLDYHFFIIEDPTVNAFALPGGYVYVHTGLLAAVADESELASVLGHEIGHVVARHGLKNFKRAQRYQFLVGLINLGIGAIGGESTAARIGQTASQLLAAGIFTKHSRDAEREADFLGLHNMYAAGYDPRGMVSMFEKLEQISRRNPDLLGAVFRTHPPASERIRNTQAEITDHLALDPRLVRDTSAFRAMKQRLRELGLAEGSASSSVRRRLRSRS
ncbi:MAG: M48 family metallopeptidase [Blastocatellia bacterium]|nr:M48 family metallopeptidase [Blastocatellia bacterium]MCS7158465.1 M48 family metallopeptidase [Blastocatellia bacterium]MCX7753464.1 M48 family metallopeptidase [Blastocatellia bacterium]MDW8167854.1 M48 family metallopeptidase [Acidobacteriota bacterium]MDW8255889.1 M48 family metallopeptidase [Acidobacteriota bacterium]